MPGPGPGRPGSDPCPGPAWPTGATRLAGVIGDPVRHSLSPAIHNAAFAALGLDWAFLAFPVVAGRAPEALAGAMALGVVGLSVTMPHKAAVLALVDRATPRAAALGAVNTVVRQGEVLMGDNTDGPGLVESLRSDQGFDPDGRRCLVVGAGGAARAVVLALAQAGAAQVVVVNRSRDRAEAAAALAGATGRVGEAADADGVELIVNATPLGMDRSPAVADPLAVPAERLGPGQLVVDLVYHPLVTPLLSAARGRGARTANGLGMLVHQAGHAFRLWTGAEPPLEVMAQAVAASHRDQS